MLVVRDMDISEVERGFAALERQAGARAGSFFAGIRPEAKKSLRGYQKDRKGPRGQAWAPRSAASRARARRGGKRRLRSASRSLLGRIPKAWTGRSQASGLVMQNAVSFFDAHDKGATVGNGAKLPARPMLGWSATFLEQAAEEWETFVGQAWGR